MEGEGESKADALAQGEARLVLLWVPLPLLVPETRADAVPRKPRAAAPPVALGLPVPPPLTDSEGVVEEDSEPEPEELAVGEARLLNKALSDTDTEGVMEGGCEPEPATLAVVERQLLGEEVSDAERVAH